MIDGMFRYAHLATSAVADALRAAGAPVPNDKPTAAFDGARR
jgi:hypothetical protein